MKQVYSCKELKNFWKVKFNKFSDNCVEVQVPVWTSRKGTWLESYRVERQNENDMIIARPAKGSFHNGYDYLMLGKLKHFGYTKIFEKMQSSRGMSFVFVNETYSEVWASTINEARKMLI